MSKKILIVDDEEEIREVLGEYLAGLGHIFMEAENGEQAYEVFKENKFDLVISDINMPKMNGLKLLKLVKAIAPNLPVILTTGFELTKQEIRSLAVKPDAFVKKPFSLEYINYLIRAFCSKTI